MAGHPRGAPTIGGPARARAEGGRRSPRGAPGVGGGTLPATARRGSVWGPSSGGHGPGPSAAPCSCPGRRPDPSGVRVCALGAAWHGPPRGGLRAGSPLGGSSGPLGGWAGWEEPSGKFPFLEMASVGPCVPAPHPEVPACLAKSPLPWGRGTVGLEVLAGFDRSSAHAPAPHAPVAPGALWFRGPGAPGDHPRTRP